jgi:hypothetical protein
MLVHMAAANDTKRITRSGIKAQDTWLPDVPNGVFAMAVTPNFYISHQWLRELKRRDQRTIDGIYFRIPDDEAVWVGHYNQNHRQMTADEAVGIIFGINDAEGFEIIVPRSIDAKELHNTHTLPQVVGWRYMPGAHGRKPCGCPVCLPRGEIKSRKIREDYENN